MLSLTLCTGFAEGPERVAREVAVSFGMNVEGICLQSELSPFSRDPIGSITPLIDYGTLCQKIVANIATSEGVIVFRPRDLKDQFVDVIVKYCTFGASGPRRGVFRPHLVIANAVNDSATSEDIEADAQRFVDFIIEHRLTKINITGAAFNSETTATSTLDIFTSPDIRKEIIHSISDNYIARIRIFLRAAFTKLIPQMMMREPLRDDLPLGSSLGGCQCKTQSSSGLSPLTFGQASQPRSHSRIKHLESIVPVPLPSPWGVFNPSDYLNFPLE